MKLPRSGLVAPAAAGVVGAGACVFVLWADPTTPGGPTPLCPTKALLGITCPGCGAARMLYALLHGDLAGALHFNAVGVVALAAVLWSYAVWLASRATGRPLPRWQDLRWAPQVTLAVVALWWAVRVVPLEPFRSLQV